jgi:hypothetical protein
MSDDVPSTTTPDLSGVRDRRAQLSRGAAVVERALAGSATGGAQSSPGELAAAVAELLQTWHLHVQRSEDADGLLAQVVLEVPRVAPKVARIRREHRQIAAALEQLAAALAEARPPDGDEECRDGVRAVLGQVAQHRGLAGDLVHEAYHVDIGGE